MTCVCDRPLVPVDWIESSTWAGTCLRCGRELDPSWFTNYAEPGPDDGTRFGEGLGGAVLCRRCGAVVPGRGVDDELGPLTCSYCDGSA